MRSLVYEVYQGATPILTTFSWAEAEALKCVGCTYRTRLVARREKESEFSKKWTAKRLKALSARMV